jgi:hypothetical protein
MTAVYQSWIIAMTDIDVTFIVAGWYVQPTSLYILHHRWIAHNTGGGKRQIAARSYSDEAVK